MSKEIIEKIEEQDKYFDKIYDLLETIYREMPTSIDVNKENLENSVREINEEVKDLKQKIDYLTQLIEGINN